MDALEALHTRNSVAQLTEPAPTTEQLDNILQAAMRANDHRRLRPWKFLIVDGEARNKLGQLMLKIKLQDEPELAEDQQQRIVAKPLRAPLVIVVIAKVRSDENVPDIEQILSAGGAAQLMMVAAHAQGVGAIWRTGGLAYDARMRTGLDLEEGDQIVGFLYMGTAQTVKRLAEMNPQDYILPWSGVK